MTAARGDLGRLLALIAVPPQHALYDEEQRTALMVNVCTLLNQQSWNSPLVQLLYRKQACKSLNSYLHADSQFAIRLALPGSRVTPEEADRWYAHVAQVNPEPDVAMQLVPDIIGPPSRDLVVSLADTTVEKLVGLVECWLHSGVGPFSVTYSSRTIDAHDSFVFNTGAAFWEDFNVRCGTALVESRDSTGVVLNERPELYEDGFLDGAVVSFRHLVGGGGGRSTSRQVNVGQYKLTLFSPATDDKGNCGLQCICRALKYRTRYDWLRESIFAPPTGPLDAVQLQMAFRFVLSKVGVKSTTYRQLVIACPTFPQNEYARYLNSPPGEILMIYLQPGIFEMREGDEVCSATTSATRQGLSSHQSRTTSHRSRTVHDSVIARVADVVLTHAAPALRQRDEGIKGHYWIVTAVEHQPQDPAAYRQAPLGSTGGGSEMHRGRVTYDVETRKALNVTRSRAKGKYTWNPMVVTILHATVAPISRRGINPDDEEGAREFSIAFTAVAAPEELPQWSPIVLTAEAQFLDWLRDESRAGRHYVVYAHNGGCFDHRWLLNEMTKEEMEASSPLLRGSTIVSFEFYGHLFRDTCLVLSGSLEKLCESYKIGKDCGKTVQVTLDDTGEQISSTELCFYKPELGVKAFLDYLYARPQFRRVYNEYCQRDTTSLLAILRVFIPEFAAIVKKIDVKLLKSCNAATATTTGALGLKLFTKSAALLRADAYKSCIQALTPSWPTKDTNGVLLSTEKLEEGKTAAITRCGRIESALREYIIGGISHCKGSCVVSDPGITGYDVVSQYPFALVDAMIPCGTATIYDGAPGSMEYIGTPGFYTLEDAKWTSQAPKFLPVVPVKSTTAVSSYDWTARPSSFRASHSMIAKLLEWGWLDPDFVVRSAVTFDSERPGADVFGPAVYGLYAEKQKQDQLKGTPQANPAARAIVKLLLNAAIGKFVENTGKYTSFVPATTTQPDAFIGFGKFTRTRVGRINAHLVFGLCVYFHSKVKLFEYMRQLPGVPGKSNGGPDSVYAVETDGFYVGSEQASAFEAAVSDKIATGDLGSLTVDKRVEVGVFLAKKSYALVSKDTWEGRTPLDPASMRFKGVRPYHVQCDGKKTIAIDGDILRQLAAGRRVELPIAMWEHQLVMREPPDEWTTDPVETSCIDGMRRIGFPQSAIVINGEPTGELYSVPPRTSEEVRDGRQLTVPGR